MPTHSSQLGKRRMLSPFQTITAGIGVADAEGVDGGKEPVARELAAAREHAAEERDGKDGD